MARGWESKSVEEQQSERLRSTSERSRNLTPEEKESERRRQGLKLSRQRLEQQLGAARNERHREMLRLAIDDIDKQLASIH